MSSPTGENDAMQAALETPDEFEDFEDLCDMGAFENLGLFLEMFKYQTFEYKTTLKSLTKARRISNLKDKPAKSEFRLLVKKGENTETIIVKLEDGISVHMRVLLTFAERRGWRQKTSGELKECLEILCSMYGITRGGCRSKPKALTMWHVAATFPHLVVRIYHEGAGDAIVSRAQLGLPDNASRGFVSGKVHSVLDKATLQHIKFICLYCLVLIDNAINSSRPRSFMSIASYFRGGSCSSSCPDELKALMPTESHLGLLRTVNGVEVFESYLAKANIFCMAKLRALYPGEDIHNVLL